MNVSATRRRLGDLAGAMRHNRRLAGVGCSREELLALQRGRLLETARHAAAASPLYRELYADVELSDDLDPRALPVVTKAMLMDCFDEWVTDPRLHLAEVQAHLEGLRTDERYRGSYRCVVSGGTSGHKGIFVYDRDEWRRLMAMYLRYSELAGLPQGARAPRMRTASVTATSPLHVTGRLGMSFDLPMFPFCRLDARTPLPELVAALNEHRPGYLAGYPSMVSLLAIEQIEGRLRIDPRFLATGGEVRTEEMASNIRDAWGVEPFDQYATSEGLYGSECGHHQGIHLFEDLALVEVLDERGDPVPDGVLGAKLLITSFIKRTQPLLRYELSDMVALSSEPCACGRPFARIVSIDGRSDDILHLNGQDGQAIAVHPLTLRSPMAALPELRQYKIVHDEEGVHVLVTLRDGVAAQEASQRIEAMLRGALHGAGVDPQLNIATVAELPPDPGHGAKFKVIEARPAPEQQ
jgi:phenylacetate-CoA ligase